MSKDSWKLEQPLGELHSHLENAYKRVSGLIGFKMSRDRLNLDALSGSAADILDINLGSGEPFFMRLGRSLGTAVTYRPKNELSLKELAAEVLDEFYREATGAFQELKIRLRDQAGEWLEAQGVDPERRRGILEAADDSFLAPGKEEMMRQAMPYVRQRISPGTAATFGGFGGFGLLIALLRHPVMGLIGAAAGAALLYYLTRNQTRKLTLKLLSGLPQDLFNCLRRDLLANINRYEEIINGCRRPS